MEMHGLISAADEIPSDPTAELEESMWQLGLGSGGEDCVYPERPGEQNCSYFVRTGFCGYGERCRYNHPRDRGVVRNAGQHGSLENSERVSQPLCQNFLKNGTCRFGSMCRYHHRTQAVEPVMLNNHGHPIRQGEKECPYYVKTGQCKFGSACRFHHPQPFISSIQSPASAVYPVVQPPLVPSPQQYPTLASWQVAGPSASPTSYIPGPGTYGPVLISPSIVPVPGWSTYQPPGSPLVSSAGPQMVRAGLSYTYLSSPSTLSHPGAYPQKEYKLPERPGKPVCHHYTKTGVCKFGTMCRYHHPPDYHGPYSNCVLSPLGLPLRPGALPCPFYAQHGVCKFGPTCKYDHPLGTPRYGACAYPLASNPIGFPFANLPPPASYTEL